MVKKLIKHEINYYARIMVLFLPALLLLGLMVRIFSLFESNWFGYYITYYSSVLLLYFGSIAIELVIYILTIVRFYKNMFSQEGYLTFTIPATTFELIFSKVLVSILCMIVSSLTVVISWMISGFFNVEISGEIIFEINELFQYVNILHIILYIIEFIILLFVISIYSIILAYTCITIGQTAKKNRILLAVGAYFVYYILVQVIVTVLMIVFIVFGISGALDWIPIFISNAPYLFFHLIFIIAILVYSGLIILGYFIIRNIINNKLNLE